MVGDVLPASHPPGDGDTGLAFPDSNLLPHKAGIFFSSFLEDQGLHSLPQETPPAQTDTLKDSLNGSIHMKLRTDEAKGLAVWYSGLYQHWRYQHPMLEHLA